MKIITAILAIRFYYVLNGQQLKMESFKIVSRANDTVEDFKAGFMVMKFRSNLSR